MKHWSVDTKELEKDKDAYTAWRLEQKINWGLGGGAIDRDELIKYWDRLDLDPFKRRFLSLILSRS